MGSLGEAVLDLRANFQKYNRDIDAAGQKAQSLDAKFKATSATLKKLGSSLQSAGVKMTAFVTAPIVGLGALAVALADVQIQAEAGLAAALTFTGVEAQRVLPDLKAFASGLQDVTTVGDETTLKMLQVGISMGLTADGAKAAVKEAIGLSKAFGIAETTAIRMTASLVDGDTTMLNRYIPALKGVKDEAERVALAHKLLAGAFEVAVSEAENGLGPWKQLSNLYGDLLEDFGAIILEGLEPLADAMKTVVEWLQGLDDNTKRWIVTIAAILAAIGPVLVALGTFLAVLGSLVGMMASGGAIAVGFGLFASSIGAVVAVLTGPVGLIVALSILSLKIPLVRGVLFDIADAAVTVAERITGLTLRVREFNDAVKVSTEEESDFLAMMAGGGPILTTVKRQVDDLWRVQMDLAQAAEDAAAAGKEQTEQLIEAAAAVDVFALALQFGNTALLTSTTATKAWGSEFQNVQTAISGSGGLFFQLELLEGEQRTLAEATRGSTADFGDFFAGIRTGNQDIDSFLGWMNSLLGIFDSIIGALGGLGSAFGDFFSSLGGLFKGGGEDAAGGFLSGFGGGGEGSAGIMSGLSGFLSAAGPWIAIGLAVAGPLLKGIKAGLGKLVGFFKGLFGGPSGAEVAGRQAAATFRDALRAGLSADVLADVLLQFPNQSENAAFLAAIQQMLIAAGVAAEEAGAQARQWGILLAEAEAQGADAVQLVIDQINAATQAAIDGNNAITDIVNTSTTFLDRRFEVVSARIKAAGLTAEQEALRLERALARIAARIAARQSGTGSGTGGGGFAHGSGGFQDFGQGTNVTLHGIERVQTVAQASASDRPGAVSDTAIVDELRRLRQDINTVLPAAMEQSAKHGANTSGRRR